MDGVCLECHKALSGRQRKYCSRRCKNRHTNQQHQSYLAQQRRGRRCKLKLLSLLGGQCGRCGYSSNHAALEFHHLEPESKSFSLDLRSLTNRSRDSVLSESGKCVVLCSNYHAEEHNPDCLMPGT